MDEQKRTRIVVEALQLAKMSEETKILRRLTIISLLKNYPLDKQAILSEMIETMTDAIFSEGVGAGVKSMQHLVENGLGVKLSG